MNGQQNIKTFGEITNSLEYILSKKRLGSQQ